MKNGKLNNLSRGRYILFLISIVCSTYGQLIYGNMNSSDTVKRDVTVVFSETFESRTLGGFEKSDVPEWNVEAMEAFAWKIDDDSRIVEWEDGKAWHYGIREGVYGWMPPHTEGQRDMQIDLDTGYNELYISGSLYFNRNGDNHHCKFGFGAGSFKRVDSRSVAEGGNECCIGNGWECGGVDLRDSIYYGWYDHMFVNTDYVTSWGFYWNQPNASCYNTQFKLFPVTEVTKEGGSHFTWRFKMNDLGKANGISEVFVNGKLVAQKTDCRFLTYSNPTENIKTIWLAFFYNLGAEPNSDTYIILDDLQAYYYNSDDPDYIEGISPEGREIDPIKFSFDMNGFQKDTIIRQVEVNSNDADLKPNSPSELNISFDNNNYSFIEWNDNSDNETSFIIERSEGTSSNFSVIVEVDPETTSYIDTVFTEGIYFYRVAAVNEAGKSNYSNIIQINVELPPGKSGNTTAENKNQTIYLDPQNVGDEEADGSMEHPYSSWLDVKWAKGSSYLQKKGTVSYINKLLITEDSVSISSYGKSEEKAKIVFNTKEYAIKAIDKKGIHIKGLNIVASDAVGSIYFMGEQTGGIYIENCELSGSVFGIRIMEGKDATIRYNQFNDNFTAVYTSCDYSKIYYNIFTSNEQAIDIYSYYSAAEVYNNTFYDNSSSVSSSYGELSLYNNIIYLTEENDKALTHLSGKLFSDYNLFYPEKNGFIELNDTLYNTLGAFQASKKLDLNSLTEDPLFMDLYNNNFRLKSNSPAIEKGKFYQGIDFLGTLVPFGDLTDIGACEYNLKNGDVEQTTKVEIIDNSDDVMVYPNPSSGLVNINLKNIDEIKEDLDFSVTNTMGKILYQEKMDPGENQRTFDLSHLPRGMYFIRIQNSAYSALKKVLLH